VEVRKSAITIFMTYALRLKNFLLIILLQISCFTASVFLRLLMTCRKANRFRYLVGLLIWGVHQSQFLWSQYRQQVNTEEVVQPSIHLTNRSNHSPTHPPITLRISNIRSANDPLCLRPRDECDSLFFNYLNN
jgi:hypothetical protein